MASKRKPKTGGADRAKRSTNSTTKRSAKYEGPPIHCGHTRIASTSSLRPHPQNPNTHSESQIKLLAKNIEHMGWRHPIIVSKLTGFIVAGHARLRAAELLGLKSVPVEEQTFASETEERAYLIADNRIAELAEIDSQVLKDLLQELDTGEFDMDLTGFTTEELEMLMTQVHVPDDNKDIDEDAMSQTSNECPKCGFKW